MDTKRPNGFMSFPLEIRFEIYSYLLHLPSYRPHEYQPCHVHPNILLANHQINWEATPLLYNENTFIAHPTLLTSLPRLREWYMPVRELEVLPRIRRFHITVRLDCDLPCDKTTVAKAFSGVEELTIEVVQTKFMGAGYKNLTRFDRVRGVSRVTIRGSTTGFEEYVSWLRNAMMSQSTSAVGDFMPPQSCRLQATLPQATLWLI